ncbi:DUF721 domain-containing protein [Patescibacteria group bacterium]|nr:DUF721 domain-containing protein [Patescibacteria group bacterium]
MSEFQPFQNWVPKTLQKYKLARQARASLICERFRKLVPEMIGEDCAGVVRPKSFKGGTLYVSVPSSSYAQRVYVHRHDIIMKLNLEVDNDFVHDIRTVVEAVGFANDYDSS